MNPTFFPTPAAFRAWLAANHATATELLVGFHKVGSGKPSITWPQSVDQALCFGWIDGVRRSLGATLHDPLHAAAGAQHLERDQHQALRRAPQAGAGQRRRDRGVRAAERRPLGRLQLRAGRRPGFRARTRSRSARTRRRGRFFSRARPGTGARRGGSSAPRSRRRAPGGCATLIADSAAGRTIGPLTRPGA